MKLIQDVVYNHVGRFHFLVQDPPEKDWLHQWPTFTQTNYKDQSYFDPYAAPSDHKKLVDGWFTTEMPDLNHQNPFIANFLIQHALWTIETFGVDGFRVDTYIYNDLKLMNQLNNAVLQEFPKFTTFGENWVHGVSNQAYFVENNMQTPFKSNLQGAVDFQLLFYGILPSLNEKFGWTDGVNKLYNTLSNDFLYKDPTRNVIFLDNHDMTRILSSLNGDVAKLKMAILWLMTCRGIPQMYYGTEILMKGVANPDGWVRLDFPGGWDGDAKNAFTGVGMSKEELSMQQFVVQLAHYRKQTKALQNGQLMQYLPKEGLYVYFRYDQNKTIMCIMNTDDKERMINFGEYSERTNGFQKGKDIVEQQIINDHFLIPAHQMRVLELIH
jgi:glycosidase